MSAHGQEKETELHERLAAYIHGGGDWGDDEGFETNTPGSPDPLFDSPGPSNIASAFAAAAAASNHVRTRSRSTRPRSSRALPETEDQDEGNTDNDGWTDTDSVASHASSARPDATFTAGAGGTGGSGGARRVGHGNRGRPAAGGAPSMGFGMGEENPVPTVSNVAVPYTCWSCSAMVSIRRKESLVMCTACGGRVVMKVRPEQ